MPHKKYITPFSLERLQSTVGENDRLPCDVEMCLNCHGDSMELLTFKLKDKF